MNEFESFKMWLDANTAYTKATKSNIVSRLRRADKLMPVVADPIYLFTLSQCSEFTALSVNVKSQIRRAVRIYHQYLEGKEKTADA